MSIHFLPKLVAFLAWVGAPALAAGMQTLSLDGDWNVFQEGKAEILRAQVPGNVHLDLLREGKISDPFFRDNAAKIEWIYQTTWTYDREFEVPASLLQHEAVLLRCVGLDTVAHLEVNGEALADTDNMYRIWEFDVKKHPHSGANRIRITFSPVKSYIEAFQKRAPKVPNATGIDISNIRKAPYSNSWDFAARFLPCGIYKPVSLIAYDHARIGDIRIAQINPGQTNARLDVEVSAIRTGSSNLVAEAVAIFGKKIVARNRASFTGESTKLALQIPEPQLWWPNGMGSQPLYTIAVQLRTDSGAVLDAGERRIGIRKIELLPKSDKGPLRLAVNGREIFAKGANFIPEDVFPARVKPETLRRTVDDAAAVNMNMIRVWGGGYYPDDAFFDACDEKGILVWNEFMFACAPYPGNNPEFQDNVRAELTDQVQRLRHHPSIAVWCGNNEVSKLVTGFKLITQEEYDRLFHQVIGTKFKQLFPEGNYVGGSPEAGDDHNWWVWHVGADYEKYRESHEWITEFGFQSFPHPATVASYTDAGDRDSVFSAISLFHQKNGEGKGNHIMLDKMHGYFRDAKDFESTLWLSQINQSYAMNLGIEHWRSDWPASSGSLVWQLNDCWPGPTWSSIDYYGRWKAAQYGYRRAFAPVMITGVPPREGGDFTLKIASDLSQPTNAALEWKLVDLEGKTLASGKDHISLPAGTSSSDGPKLTLGRELEKAGRNKVLLWTKIDTGGSNYSNVLFFSRPKELELTDPHISNRIATAGDGFDITLTSEAPALWVWISCADPDARYSDNFLHLFPGEPATIHIKPAKPLTIEQLRSLLKIRSLRDTYAHP